MEYLPVSLALKGQKVLLVGGGQVATRKARTLLKAGAVPGIVSQTVTEFLQEAIRSGAAIRLPGDFAPEQLDDVAVVVCATDDEQLNTRVAAAARARHIPVNVVDAPALCTFIMPAIVDRSPITIAISSGGAAPVLARRLRARLEAEIPSRLGDLATAARKWRERVKAALPDFTARRQFWERFFDQTGNQRYVSSDEVHVRLQHMLKAPTSSGPGTVYLVGAGPGDPELLTLKALRVLQQADVILHDRLVSSDVLELARRDAELISVGKTCGGPSVGQDQTNHMMVELARSGLSVCRLKGGDPFMFGRGGEEVAYLRAHDIAYEVVPGITAAAGCAAYAGIPLTHRDMAQSCVFVTAHPRRNGPEPDWKHLASVSQTLVFYMGLGKARQISARLIQHGLPGSHPVAIIENGTTAKQRTIVGHLDDLVGLISRNEVKSPALIMVGEVVRLAENAHLLEEPEMARVEQKAA